CDGDECILGGTQTEQGGIGTFGEVPAAGGAVQTADALPSARPAVQTQVAGAALAVDGAVGVGAGHVPVFLGAHRFPPFSPGYYLFTQPGTCREALRSHHQLYHVNRELPLLPNRSR